MAAKAGTVWVKVGETGGERVRASRISEFSAAVPGQIVLRVVGHREPIVLALEGLEEPQATISFTDKLLALIERHSQRRAVSVIIGYRPGDGTYLPHWSVRTLPDLTQTTRPVLDRAALPVDGEPLTAQQEEMLAVMARDAQLRAES